MPPDNSMQIEAMRQQQAQEARAAEDRKEKARKEELLGLRTAAGTSGRTSAEDYFRQQGLDAGQYAGDIGSKVNKTMAGISADDPNPGAAFADIGQSLFGELEGGARSKAGRDLDQMFSPDFEMKRLGLTVDDPYLAGVEAEQRSSADEILRRMLERGVITDTGYAAGAADLDKQAAGVKSRLNEIGTGLLGTGQQSLRDVANRGRTAASTLKLGTAFDPNSFGSEADRITSEFLANLGTGIRSRITGNLFSTGGLGATAGGAQGGQNTAFNPGVTAGIDAGTPKDEEDEEATTGGDKPLF
jgi:hypothetical protein